MAEDIFIALIGASAVLVGTLIGIVGQILGNWIDHKKRIEFLVFETFFKQKLSYLERLGLGIEKVVNRESEIFFLLGNIGNKIGSRTLSKAFVKSAIKKSIIATDKDKLEDFKPNGKGIYISDNSPIIAPLNSFILAHANMLLAWRKLIDGNLKDVNLIRDIIATIPQDTLIGKKLLDEIRKEMLPSKNRGGNK